MKKWAADMPEPERQRNLVPVKMNGAVKNRGEPEK